MMRCAALVVAAVLLAAAPDARQASPAPPVTESAPVQAWVDAFNSRDPKRIVALYAPDAVFWGTTAQTMATTPEAVWAYFKDTGQRPDTRVTITEQHARIYGTMALVSGAYTFSDVRDGVASNVRPARFTFVFRRDGVRWLIVEHHSSRVPER